MAQVIQILFKRIIYLIITLIFISLIIFTVTQIIPGDVAYAILGQSATEENVQALREQLGLMRPLHVQYLSWLGDFVRLNLGNSLSLSRPIAPILMMRLKRTLILGILTFAEITFFGILLGLFAGLRKDKLFDHISSAVSFVLVAVPEFVSGSILILLLGGVYLDIFPSSGYVPLSEGFIPWIMHLVLPSTTLMTVMLAYVLRMTRSSTIEVLRQNYIRTARLNGLRERRIIFVHVLKNALLPTVTLLANNIGWLIGGVVIVETVFAYPGVGQLLIHSITYRDIPLLQSTTMLVAFFYVASSILADIFYIYLDPRTREAI